MEQDNCQEEKINKIKSIIEKEIGKELQSKQNELIEINERIEKTLRHLEILKYVAAYNYYEQNPTITSKKNSGQDEENKDEKAQTQIHPCIKKLMPFRSNYNKIVNDFGNQSRPYETRNKRLHGAESSSSNVHASEKLQEASLTSLSNLAGSSECLPSTSGSVKVPQYIPPLPKNDVAGKINSQRGSLSKVQHRIIVGNVSKWIPPDTREDNSTHKWMVYVRNQDKDKDVSTLIRKVRYFLHESYKPHDIIEVTSAPFHLTRRGWGEFPIRVQLHFTHPLNKPVDIIHNLKLDMTCSGVQTLGAETVVEVSLHHSNNSSDCEVIMPNKNKSINDYANGRKMIEKQDVFDSQLLPRYENKKSESEVLNLNSASEIEDDNMHSYHKKIKTELEDQISTKELPFDCKRTLEIINREHDYCVVYETDQSQLSVENKQEKKNLNSYSKMTSFRNHNVDRRCNGSILDALSVSDVLSNANLTKSDSKIIFSRNEKEIFKLLKSLANKYESEVQSKYCMKTFKHNYLVNMIQRVHASKLRTVEALIKWFFQRWPIITELALDPTYKFVHPYSCPSEEEFFKYNIGKQRSAEWFRAKAIQKILLSLKDVIPIDEEIWTTKQILLWSRFHGFSPLSSSREAESKEVYEMPHKRLKSGESSSDTDDDSFSICSKRSKSNDGQFLNGLSISERRRRSRKKENADDVLDRRKINYRNINTYTSDAVNGIDAYGAMETRILKSAETVPEIDIVSVERNIKSESPSKRKESLIYITTTSPSEQLLQRFISETSRQIGVKFTEEEVIPNVMADSVTRVMSQAVLSFVEDLLRKSLAQGWLRNEDRAPNCLQVEDVIAAIVENPVFDIFTNRGLGALPSEKSKQ